MRYYLIAGERSGDLHGANLIRAIKKLDFGAEFRCWGGDFMQETGAELVVHHNNLAFMGFLEVLIYFRRILRYLNFCKKDVLSYRPDVVILIDFGGFNMKVASFLRRKEIKVFYYISPKIWAWNTGRAKNIKKLIDRMFVILPFEKDFYSQYGYEVDYVGNPVVDAVLQHTPDPSFLDREDIVNKDNYVALLPGSREQELKSILPSLAQLAVGFPDVQFILAGIHSLPVELYEVVEEVPNVVVVYDRTYDVLAFAKTAVVTSGTATLETTLWDVPQVVIYRSSSWLSVTIARLVIKVKFISLVNLIAGREVVRELIQKNLNPDHLHTELDRLIHDDAYRKRIHTDYAEIRNVLGTDPASDKAAVLMLKYLRS